LQSVNKFNLSASAINIVSILRFKRILSASAIPMANASRETAKDRFSFLIFLILLILHGG
jgi:hypothetical protein